MPLGPTTIFAEIEDLARAQHGVITAAQITRYGLSRETLSHLASTKRLIRIMHGAYVLPSLWKDTTPWRQYELKVRAAAIRGQRRGEHLEALSHVSAAVLWRLPLLTTPSFVHFVSTSATCGRRGIVYKHRAEDERDICTRDGIAITTLRRTVVDCATILPFTDAVALADVALARMTRAEETSRADVARAQELHRDDLIDLAIGRRHRTAKARDVLLFADGRSGSPAESKARVIMRAIGLPIPELQLRIDTDYGTFYPDFAFPDWGVLVEIDGKIKVADPFIGDPVLAVERERLRHIHLQEMGWEIARLTWKELQLPETVREKIHAAARRARGRGIVRATDQAR